MRTVAVSRHATPSLARKATGHSQGFRKLVKWRPGSAGRTSYLRHAYGWDRFRLNSTPGAAIWCGYGVFVRSLVKIEILAS